MSGKAGGVGERLKREREAKGISLDELSRATKIRRVLLESLEGERWGDLPGAVFTSGYIKAIAAHLHLEGESLAKEWEGQTIRTEKPLAAVASWPIQERRSFLPWLALGLLALISLAAGLWWVNREPAASQAGPVPMSPPARVPEPLFSAPPITTQPSPEALEGEIQGVGTSTVPQPTTKPAAAAQDLAIKPSPSATVDKVPEPAPLSTLPKGDLVIILRSPCWMELQKGGKRLVYREVQVGESLSFDGDAFALTVGDASAVAVYWKGRRVAVPDTPGKVIKDLRLGAVSP